MVQSVVITVKYPLNNFKYFTTINYATVSNVLCSSRQNVVLKSMSIRRALIKYLSLPYVQLVQVCKSLYTRCTIVSYNRLANAVTACAWDNESNIPPSSTPLSREADSGYVDKKCRSVLQNANFSCVTTTGPQDFTWNQLKLVHTTKNYLFNIQFNIIMPCLDYLL